MDISFAFLVAGVIILIGFFGGILFDKTKITDVLILLGVGVLLGPVFKFINPHELTHFAEYFGSFALIIILFEGGMSMSIEKLIKEFGTATLFVILVFFLTTAALAAFLHYSHGWSVIRSLLLGTILGCTSAAIVIPIVDRMALKDEMKVLLSIESSLSDVLAVVLTVTFIEFAALENIGIKAPFRAVASSFSIAIVAGVASGLLWLRILDFFREEKFTYMTTLAAILIVFAAVTFLNGSGPVAILIFGVILGNRIHFASFLKLKSYVSVDETIKFFHREVTFFIRTFFFVYMGMMITTSILNVEHLMLSGALVLIILLMRYLGVAFTGLMAPAKRADRFVMLSMLPRGLASAVLATLPMSAGIPESEDFIVYTFAVIVLTNVVMTLGVFFTERSNGTPPLPPKEGQDVS